MIPTIYLIRHATPDWSRTDLVYHLPPGPPLTAQGEAEAAKLGDFLRDMDVRHIFTSPLVRCLRTAEIAGAAVDVQELEPPRAGEPLLQLPNVLFTPHTASWSAEAVLQLRRETAQNVVRVLAGQPPRSVVNPKVLAKVA